MILISHKFLKKSTITSSSINNIKKTKGKQKLCGKANKIIKKETSGMLRRKMF